MNGHARILNQWSPAWWEYTLHATWQAVLTTAILLSVAALGRKWPAPWRYGVLLVALLKFAVPPFLSVPSGAFSQLGPRVEASAPIKPGNQPSVGAARDPHFTGAVSGEADPELGMRRPPDSSVFAARTVSAHPGMVIAKGAKLDRTAWLMLLHFAGCAAMFFWIARQLSRLRRAVRASRPIAGGPLRLFLNSLAAELKMKRTPTLRISERLAAPVAFGVLHPTILMPATNLARFSERELKVILAHELAHFRRGDLWVNWAQILLQAIWWFNPLLWMLNTALRKAREDCCDDLLLARKLTSGDLYCDTLLRAAVEFGRAEPLTGALGFGERLHPMGRRFARIMDAGVPRAYRLSALGFLVVLGMGFLLLPGLRSQTASFGEQSRASNQPPGSAIALNPGGSAPAPAPATNAASWLFGELKLDFVRSDRNQAVLRRDFKGHGQVVVTCLTNGLARAATARAMRSISGTGAGLPAPSPALQPATPEQPPASPSPVGPTASAVMPEPATNAEESAGRTNAILTVLVGPKPVVRLGDPVEVSLSVKNQGDRELAVAKNATAFACFEVTDAEGQSAPYVGYTGQVPVEPVTVQPSSAVTIAERLDLTDKYLFQRPGRYAIRFSGILSLSSFSGRISPIPAIPPSNTILVDIGPGQLSELDEIVAQLLPVCPKGWGIMKSSRGLDETAPFGRGRVRGYSAHIYRSFMGGEAVYLWLTKAKAPISPEKDTETSQYRGHTRGLHVYVAPTPKAKSVWPKALEDISRVLQIEEDKARSSPTQPALGISRAAAGG